MPIALDQLTSHELKKCVQHEAGEAATPHHAAACLGISPGAILQAQTLLAENQEQIIVVTSVNQGINLARAKKFLGMPVSLLVQSADASWDAPIQPGQPSVRVWCDVSLDDLDFLYLPTGVKGRLVEIPQEIWKSLSAGIERRSIARPVFRLSTLTLAMNRKVRRLLAQAANSGAIRVRAPVRPLPALTEAVQALLKLKNRPDVTVDEVVSVMEKDATVTAHLLRHAQSPVFGGARIRNLHQAIYVSLGVPDAINIALAVQLAQTVELPPRGALSRSNIWKSSFATAILARRICQRLDPEATTQQLSDLYLGGLLSQIGMLAMAASNAEDFASMNEMLELMPDRYDELVRAFFSQSPARWGRSLLQSWALPEDIVALAVSEVEPGRSSTHAQAIIIYARQLAQLIVDGRDWRQISLPRCGITLSESLLDELIQQSRNDLQTLPAPYLQKIA